MSCVRGVEDLVVDGESATATVRSQFDDALRYQVRLQGAGPAGECDCPQGLEGRFCKHCAAVGLRVLGADAPVPDRPAAPAPQRPTDEWPAVLGFLAGRSAPELVALLHGVARDDAGVRHRLWLLATAAGDAGAPAPIEAEVLALARGYDVGGGARYADQVRAAAFALTQLPAQDAARATDLLQRTITHAFAALDTTQDPDGDSDYYNDDDEYAPDDDQPVSEALDVAWQAYLRLCAAAPPAPDRLAAWYVGLRLRHPGYRSRVPAAALAAMPGVLAACRAELRDHDDETAWSLHDEVLRAAGDVDAHVAFLAEDLSTYARYAKIAELLDAAGRGAEAVTWLERARQPAPPPSGNPEPVVELLSRLYTSQGRLDDALQVRRRHFGTARTERAYRALRDAARRAGADWAPLRDGVLDLLRREPVSRPDTVVRILILEGESDEAWQLANQRRCDEDTMVVAARARGVTHPADAIPVYRSQLADALRFNSRDRNRAYERAADLLLILRDLSIRSTGSFTAELAAFKRTHGRKTNLMAALARRGL